MYSKCCYNPPKNLLEKNLFMNEIMDPFKHYKGWKSMDDKMRDSEAVSLERVIKKYQKKFINEKKKTNLAKLYMQFISELKIQLEK